MQLKDEAVVVIELVFVTQLDNISPSCCYQQNGCVSLVAQLIVSSLSAATACCMHMFVAGVGSLFVHLVATGLEYMSVVQMLTGSKMKRRGMFSVKLKTDC